MQIFFSYGHDTHAEVVKRLADEVMRRSGGEVKVWIDTYKIPRDEYSGLRVP